MITQQSYRIMIPGKSLFLRMITCQKSCGQSCVVNYNSEDFIQTGTVFHHQRITWSETDT